MELKLRTGQQEFVLPQLKEWKRGEAAKVLRQIQKELNIPLTNFHSIRASFITHLLLQGVPVTKVKEMTGHADLKTTQRYVRLVAKDLQNATNAIPAEVLPKPPRRRKRYPGRKRIEDRQVLTGIIFVLRTGIPWRAMPAELRLGNDVPETASAVAQSGCVSEALRNSLGGASWGREAGLVSRAVRQRNDQGTERREENRAPSHRPSQIGLESPCLGRRQGDSSSGPGDGGQHP